MGGDVVFCRVTMTVDDNDENDDNADDEDRFDIFSWGWLTTLAINGLGGSLLIRSGHLGYMW